MTQLEFDLNSTTEDVLKAYDHHYSEFWSIARELRSLDVYSCSYDPSNTDSINEKRKQQNFHFEQYEKARDILDSRHVF